VEGETADMIGVGMVGLGLAAAAHAKGYASHPQAQLRAVCDLDEGRARAFADAWEGAHATTDFEAMLRRDDISLIDVATPTSLHAPMCMAALQAGKHVHCEKPFCRSIAEGEAVAEAAAARGLRVAVGETYVFLTAHVRARALIADGAIGRPLQIRQRHGAWLARGEAAIDTGPTERNWRVDPVLSGGGAYPWIFDHAVHFFATAEYFALDKPIAEIYALPSPLAGAEHSGAPHDPYITPEVDIPLITFKFADPACQGIWMRAEPLNGKFDFMRGFSTTIIGETGLIEVLGEGGGNLLWQGQQQHLLLHREGLEPEAYRFDEGGDDVWQSEISYYSQGHINQVHHLIDALHAGQPPRYSAGDGIRAVRCALAAIQSAETGQPVRVDMMAPDYTAY
jgi:predicted dehydrogenase